MGLVGGGSYAEYARMDHRLCMPVPSNLTMVEAGSIPEVMITAHQMLMHLGQMNPGDRVLIHGAGGGVGTTMIQMAKAAGAAWIGTTSSSGKHEQLKALGVAEDSIELKKPENIDAGTGAQARRVEVSLG